MLGETLSVVLFDSAELNTLDSYVGPFVKLYVIFNSRISTTHNRERTGKSVEFKIDFVTTKSNSDYSLVRLIYLYIYPTTRRAFCKRVVLDGFRPDGPKA